MARSSKRPTKPADHRPIPRQPHQVRPRHHAQGQGPERRPRPPADAHLDHVPEVPRRPGASSARSEAKLAGKKFQPAIEPPYRWRDWAAKPDGITGDELLAFINQDEATRPDGKKGAGPVSPTCARLTSSNGDDRRDVIATVFQGRAEPHGQRLPPARRHQQGQRHPLHLQRRTAHPGRPLRIHAPRDARRRRRLRRVLHPARRRALHGRPSPTRASARPSSTPPAAPAASWSRPSTTSAKQVQDRGRPQDLAGDDRSSAASPSPCPICSAR